MPTNACNAVTPRLAAPTARCEGHPGCKATRQPPTCPASPPTLHDKLSGASTLSCIPLRYANHTRQDRRPAPLPFHLDHTTVCDHARLLVSCTLCSPCGAPSHISTLFILPEAFTFPKLAHPQRLLAPWVPKLHRYIPRTIYPPSLRRLEYTSTPLTSSQSTSGMLLAGLCDVVLAAARVSCMSCVVPQHYV